MNEFLNPLEPDENGDVTELQKDFDFKPSISIEVGLNRFAKWYFEYYGEN